MEAFFSKPLGYAFYVNLPEIAAEILVKARLPQESSLPDEPQS